MTGTSMHAPKRCEGTFCPFHNPSDHHMREWPLTVRYDRHGLTERMCPHGVGHPDPDSVAWLKKLYADGTLFRLGWLDPPDDEERFDDAPDWAFTVHGCDSCCTASTNAVADG